MTLLKANNKTGYFGVYPNSIRSKPFEARVKRDSKLVHLGRFATAEEAALCVARSPEGQAAAARAAAAAPLTSEEVLRQVQAEGLTLRVANNKAGYFDVGLANPGHPRPYKAQVWHGGKDVHLGSARRGQRVRVTIGQRGRPGTHAAFVMAGDVRLASKAILVRRAPGSGAEAEAGPLARCAGARRAGGVFFLLPIQITAQR